MTKVSDFKLRSTDENWVSLADDPAARGFILIFTCNHCPYAIAYEDRILQLDADYRKRGYPVVAICSNDVRRYPQDSFENMKIRAESKGFSFPYLHDESQEVAKAYGTRCTPEVFLLQRVDGVLKLVYRGAIDDNYRDPDQVTHSHLRTQVDALLRGEAPQYSETTAMGCSIKWK